MSKKPEKNIPNPSTKNPLPDNTKLNPTPIIPGEILLGKHDIVAFEGRATIKMTVVNHGDRPIQV